MLFSYKQTIFTIKQIINILCQQQTCNIFNQRVWLKIDKNVNERKVKGGVHNKIKESLKKIKVVKNIQITEVHQDRMEKNKLC